MFYNFDEAEWQKEPHQNSKPRLFRRLMRQQKKKKKKEEVNFLILVTGNLELFFFNNEFNSQLKLTSYKHALLF